MNTTNLHPHNLAAYERCMAMLGEHGRAAVIHPTGTGKSYVIAAVASHYQRPVIVGPNVIVLNQVRDTIAREDGGRRVECHTLQWLMMQEPEALPTDCDLIVIDEFHRAGAVEWGAALQRLRSQNPTARLLGTTATPVRPSDGGRDMAEELFTESVASEMSLAEAWRRKILPTPHYVTGLYTFDNVADEVRHAISESNRISSDEKKRRLSELRRIEVDWLRSSGMRQVVNSHVPKDIRRVIIFCASIDHLRQVRPCVDEWFGDMAVASIDTIHNQQSERRKADTMARFLGAEGRGVRILLSVNMLNEGLHADGVDCVVLLRRTSSNIVYRQQIGRCLSVVNTEGREPVVLDMVDNLTSHTAIRQATPSVDNKSPRVKDDDDDLFAVMNVTDLLQDVRQLIERLTEGVRQGKRMLTFDEHLAVVTDYCRTYQSLPTSGRNEAVASWAWLRMYHGDKPEVRALREQYGKLDSMESFKQAYIAYVNEHRMLPVSGSKDPDERRMGIQWSYFRKKLINDPDIQELRQRYSVKQRNLTERIERIRKFCEEHGRTPGKGDGDIYKEWKALAYGEYSQEPRVVDLKMTYQQQIKGRDSVSIRKRLQPAFDFLSDQQRMPRNSGPWVTEDEKRIYHQLYDLERRGAKNPIERQLMDFVERIRNIKKVTL